MKVLHTMALPRLSSGIVQQMRWEQDAAEQLGIAWDVRVFTALSTSSRDSMFVYCRSRRVLDRGNLLSRIISRMTYSRAYFQWLSGIAKNYDLILLRHNLYSLDQLWFIIRHRSKTLTVHHTLEIPELRTGPKTFRRGVFCLLESVFGMMSLTLSRGFLGVTQEIVDYEQSRVIGHRKKVSVYPNGIFYEPRKTVATKHHLPDRAPELLFVASTFASWQGLDLLLKAVIDSSADLLINLVGDLVSEEDIRMAGSDPRIVVHGRLGGEAISELAERSTIGLGSFGLHRVTMKEACSLKVREYLYNGLPVYSGHKDTFPRSFPYYRCGPVDIDKILSFAQEMASIDRRLVVSESRSYISKTVLVSRLYAELRTWDTGA